MNDLYISVERKINLGQFEAETVTMSISRMPYNATDEEIVQALSTGERAVDFIRAALRAHVAKIRREEANPDPKAPVSSKTFDLAAVQPRPGRDYEVSTSTGTRPTSQVESVQVIRTEPEQFNSFADNDEPAYIPAGNEVRTGTLVFGVELQSPPAEWTEIPITTEDTTLDPNSRGQLVALNTALSNSGFGKDHRHPACHAILAAYYDGCGPVASLKDLSKFDAALVLNWFELADMESLARLQGALQPCLI